MPPKPIITAAILALAFTGPLPVTAAGATWSHVGLQALADTAPALLTEVKQGRSGTGLRGRDRGNDDRGRDDSRSNRSNDDSTSGRSRTRVPGGSGCDSPRDILEHPECLFSGKAGKKNGATSGRDRTRVPGGSGCDSPRDLIEHPECRL